MGGAQRAGEMAGDYAVPLVDEICVVLPTGQKKFVSGLSEETTCQDVIVALEAEVSSLHADEAPLAVALWECWKTCSRRVSADEGICSLLTQWGSYTDHVHFELRLLSALEVRSARWARRLERRRRRLRTGLHHRRKGLQDVRSYASRGVWRGVDRGRLSRYDDVVREYVSQCRQRDNDNVQAQRLRLEECSSVLEKAVLERDTMLAELREMETTAEREAEIYHHRDSGETGLADSAARAMAQSGTENGGGDMQVCGELSQLEQELSELRAQINGERDRLLGTAQDCQSNEHALRQLDEEMEREEANLRRLETDLEQERALSTAASRDTSRDVSAGQTPGAVAVDPHELRLQGACVPERGAQSDSPPAARSCPPPPQRSTSREKFLELKALNAEVSRKSPSPGTTRRHPKAEQEKAQRQPNTEQQQPAAVRGRSHEPATNGPPGQEETPFNSIGTGRHGSLPHMDSLLIGRSSKSLAASDAQRRPSSLTSSSAATRRATWRSELDEKLEDAMLAMEGMDVGGEDEEDEMFTAVPHRTDDKTELAIRHNQQHHHLHSRHDSLKQKAAASGHTNGHTVTVTSSKTFGANGNHSQDTSRSTGAERHHGHFLRDDSREEELMDSDDDLEGSLV